MFFACSVLKLGGRQAGEKQGAGIFPMPGAIKAKKLRRDLGKDKLPTGRGFGMRIFRIHLLRMCSAIGNINEDIARYDTGYRLNKGFESIAGKELGCVFATAGTVIFILKPKNLYLRNKINNL